MHSARGQKGKVKMKNLFSKKPRMYTEAEVDAIAEKAFVKGGKVGFKKGYYEGYPDGFQTACQLACQTELSEGDE